MAPRVTAVGVWRGAPRLLRAPYRRTVSDLVDLDDVTAAAERTGPWVERTPLVVLRSSDVLLKAESLQASGSFKLRGAFNSLLQLTDEQRSRGVVAHSSGNHAIAVAMAAGALGVAATIVMPVDAPAVKRRWTEALGATIDVVGPASSERTARAAELAADRGLVMVEPYDSERVIAATGAIAVEILEQHPPDGAGLEIYVPVSGGGLIAGVATAAKLTDPSIRIVGVEPELAADARTSLLAGERVELPASDVARTIADGLRVQRVGELPWRHIETYVDDIVTVTEDEIRAAMAQIVLEGRIVAEPSGAVAPAAAFAAEARSGTGFAATGSAATGSAATGFAGEGRRVVRVAIVSGGNVDSSLLAGVLAAGPAAACAVGPGLSMPGCDHGSGCHDATCGGEGTL